MRVVGLTFEKKAPAKGKGQAAKPEGQPKQATEQAQEPEKPEGAEGDGD